MSKNDLNIDDLSQILEESSKKENIIYDVNIQSIDDIIKILLKYEYDFCNVELEEQLAKVIFKKDGLIKKESFIKFNIYNNLLLNTKKIAKLDLSENNIEQKGKSNYEFGEKNLEFIAKIIPGDLGENFFLKIKKSELITENIVKKQHKTSIGKVFGFLTAIFLSALILGGVFLSFIVINANSPEDVAFFTNLGINLNDINSFLQKITSFIFSSALIIQTIIGLIFLFKTLTTKKAQKTKKVLNMILSIFVLSLIFITGTSWLGIDKKIKALPNWQELSYGTIQIYDNSLLVSGIATKEESLIYDYNNIIGPIDLRFDLKYLRSEEEKKGFKIRKFIWTPPNGEKFETINNETIIKLEEKGTQEIKLEIEGEDTRIPGNIRIKDAGEIPLLNIKNIVKIDSLTLPNGGVTYRFDASDISQFGKVNWYINDFENSIFTGYSFQPSKVYFEQVIIGMSIENLDTKGNFIDKFFILDGKSPQITGEIEIIENFGDLNYILRPKNITNNFGDGFIEKFVWSIEDEVHELKADLNNPEFSGELKYNFSNYGSHIIKLDIYNSNGKSTQITKEIIVKKNINLINELNILIDGEKIEYRFNKITGEY
ncbi:MAG: hypothetical protein NWP80_02040, partial [Candidatus Gracilibacteria bacterium]|nr:hypothetical protein [Candidatus Gracilibacteria bacterium]